MPWDDFFGTLAEIGFDGIMTSCVFALGRRLTNPASSCAPKCSATSTSTQRSDARAIWRRGRRAASRLQFLEGQKMINGERLIERPLRWGMVGGGRTGPGRLQAQDRRATRRYLSPRLRRIRPRRRTRTRLRHEDRRCCRPMLCRLQGTDRKEAAREDGVEVVSIATPNFTHYEITKACLEAGLHVICEKPSSSRSRNATRLPSSPNEKGLDCRRHLRLHRPPAGPSDGSDGEEGDARRYPDRRPSVHARLQFRGRRAGQARL